MLMTPQQKQALPRAVLRGVTPALRWQASIPFVSSYTMPLSSTTDFRWTDNFMGYTDDDWLTPG